MKSTYKECPRCLFTEDISIIPEHGQCNYCDLHDKLEASARPEDLQKELKKIRSHQGQYNCIIGISGGLDSSTLLYAAVKYWGLKPLVIHFDNHWNAPESVANMNQLIKLLNVNSIRFTFDKAEYDRLNKAFLWAGVPDADIPNDIAMTKLIYDIAHKYGIKYILNGHDFRTEGSTPAKWTYMDAKYIDSVYFDYCGKHLVNYPLFTFADQIKYGLLGIQQIRPFHYGFDREAIETEMKAYIGWQNYGSKHCENIYTEFVGSKLLPEKFGIDKRRVYLSARIRSKKLDKQTAKAILENPATFDMRKLGDARHMTESLMKSKQKPREMFKRYDFKKYKFLIWILAKIKVVPYTFYVKYAK